MYPAAHFQQHDAKQLQQLINAYPLATILLPNSQSALNTVSQVPVLFDTKRQLFIAHVSKYNPLGTADGQSVQLIFNSENCYLSPSYTDNPILPSWLYASVLVTAQLKLITKQSQQEQIMKQLTEHFEQPFSPQWQLEQLPEKHRYAMYQQLSFIEFMPTHWQGIFKLSQNKSAATREQIKASLTRINKPQIAELLK
ncbi:FMN-binding negative transcriptional regulator [Pseudoalteromonas mariniglutinosa]|uniref:FMN-binding negative transcriptional regulator n=1 Tax=Pseudoalteromonas mariniglutinosa TaxID=206042 RepID=UPI00384CDFC2